MYCSHTAACEPSDTVCDQLLPKEPTSRLYTIYGDILTDHTLAR